MTLAVFNTLSGQKEPFAPIHPNQVGMYVCGVTVYDECHLGHARCYVAFDLIRRYLEYRGYVVKHVQNFTDVDDKIIRRAAERGVSPFDLARQFEGRYFEVFDRLNVLRAHQFPRATEEIDGMIRMIGVLLEKGNAYESGGDVYFSTRTFPGYGKLSKRTPESMMAGARVEISERKNDPLDFALWKSAKPGEPSWPSPWGPGRPGWHIECSVMSQKYVGDTLDIHGGGQDLIFPHHENEIAQSESASGRPFVRFFLHNGFVTMDGEKMSKSLGNFRTLDELYREISPEVLRFFIVSTHYRSPLVFTAKKLDDARAGLERLREGYRHLEDLLAKPATETADNAGMRPIDGRSFREDFEAAMDDDFNSAEAVGAIFGRLTDVNRIWDLFQKSPSIPAACHGQLRDFKSVLDPILDRVLGIRPAADGVSAGDADQIRGLLTERQAARKEKRFGDADRIRDELAGMGYQIQDTPQGPRAVRKK